MGKKSTSLFHMGADTSEQHWNLVELEVLESRRQLRQTVNALIDLTSSSTLTTGEIRQHLHAGMEKFGKQLATQLVRSLHNDDAQKRQSVVWLLTFLHDADTIPQLRHMACDKHVSRSIRLSASLALAGMGATAECAEDSQRKRLYAIS